MLSLEYLGQFFFRRNRAGSGKGPSPALRLSSQHRFPPHTAPGPAWPPQSRPPERGLEDGVWPPRKGRGRGRIPANTPRLRPQSPRWKALPGWGKAGSPASRLTSVLREAVVPGREPAAALTGLTGKEVLRQPELGCVWGRGYACAARPQAPPQAQPLPSPSSSQPWGELGS